MTNKLNTTQTVGASTRTATQTNNTFNRFLRRVFGIMTGAVLVTAVASVLTLMFGLPLVFNITGDTITGYSVLFYILLFGGLALSIWAQARAFSMRPATGAIMLFIYSVIMGIVITPLVGVAINVNPMSIVLAFAISAVMFACMALFGYKTTKNLGFLGSFLFIGMIGLILVGIVSMIWPLGGTFAMIVSAIGVLLFALFTAYDMQFLKRAFGAGGDATTMRQLAVLGALHMYISFIAMFQYILSLLNGRR